MGSIWVQSVARGFDVALDLLAAAVNDCTSELWEASMWPGEPLQADHPFLGPDWEPITDPEQRRDLAERWIRRRSTPWSVAWHALETVDYDLNGGFGPWMPPPPFAGHPHWRDLPSLEASWSASQIGGYIDYCRERVHTSLAEMTDEKAATPLPLDHRYGGEPHAWIITAAMAHTTEHAAQIRQFITAPTPRS